MANLIFTGEYYQSYPTFDTTSIFSVFAVNRYQEAVLRADYIITDKIAVNGGYSRQDYGDDALAHVYHLGCTVRPIEPVQVGVEYDNRQGFGGSINGVLADVTWDVNRNTQVAGGVSYDVYQRDILTNDEIARKYWFGGKYRLAKNMAASLRLEQDSSVRYNNYVQGRFVFDYDF
jgi:hypothetical protein